LRIITALGVALVACAAPVFAAPGAGALESYRLVTLSSAHFASGTPELTAGEKASLDDLAKRFCHTDQTVIELRGYADGAGSTKRDVALSAARAHAVERFLIERGVPAERIILLGLGEVDPGGPALLAEHQRVDVRIFVP
jgi:OOP family OmpA-OmpF porin